MPNRKDFGLIAEYIKSEYDRRKKARKDNERLWDEIDRQIAMKPDCSHKMDQHGRIDVKKKWMPETELPGQAQTLEVLVSDARRMRFPDTGPWFAPHAALTDDYLERVDFQAIIAGDKNEVPTKIDQDAADKLVLGVLEWQHRQYDFRSHWDIISAEAFKYGMGVGRFRPVKKSVFRDTARGTMNQSARLPVLFPMSIRNVYPDTGSFHLMNEGLMMGPGVIFSKTQRFEDISQAAKKGKNDPKDVDGGWMPDMLKGLSGDKNGNVSVLEFEGDLVVPRKGPGTIFIPNSIVTVIIGAKGEKTSAKIIRFRLKDKPYSSYIFDPYHVDNTENPYASSPLIKGYPIQKAAVDALNRFLVVAALNAAPPLNYDPEDRAFIIDGPIVEPNALWGSTSGVRAEQIGDPSAMLNAYIQFLNQYSDITGVNAPRLGAQTVSHTTAFAKEAELSRGTIRTVNYLKRSMTGPMTQFLNIEYDMIKDMFKGKQEVYIEAYNGYVEIGKDHLPDNVMFEVHGSGGPAEEQAKRNNMLQSLQMALSMDQLNVGMGGQPVLDLGAAIDEVLRKGGWTDVNIITRSEATPTGVVAGPEMGGAIGGPEASPGAALQALTLASR